MVGEVAAHIGMGTRGANSSFLPFSHWSMTKSPRSFMGVWQSPHCPIAFTRYSPRAICPRSFQASHGVIRRSKLPPRSFTFAGFVQIQLETLSATAHFMVGGVNVPSDPTNGPNSDSFTASTDATLTTDWAKYEIPLTGHTYTDVLGGFAWSVTTKSSAPVTFYLDDVRWE